MMIRVYQVLQPLTHIVLTTMALLRSHIRFYSNAPEILPYSTVKRIRNPLNNDPVPIKIENEANKPTKDDKIRKEPTVSSQRENQFKIQMLSQSLFHQIFKNCDRNQNQLDPGTFKR